MASMALSLCGMMLQSILSQGLLETDILGAIASFSPLDAFTLGEASPLNALSLHTWDYPSPMLVGQTCS